VRNQLSEPNRLNPVNAEDEELRNLRDLNKRVPIVVWKNSQNKRKKTQINNRSEGSVSGSLLHFSCLCWRKSEDRPPRLSAFTCTTIERIHSFLRGCGCGFATLAAVVSCFLFLHKKIDHGFHGFHGQGRVGGVSLIFMEPILQVASILFLFFIRGIRVIRGHRLFCAEDLVAASPRCVDLWLS
jgi:hypothetical protein